MLAIKTIDGRKSIDGNTFKIIKGQQIDVFENLTEDELKVICKRAFWFMVINL